MRFRGEDPSRSAAAWEEQSPRRSSTGARTGGSGSWGDGRQPSQDGYPADGFEGYAPHDQRAGNAQQHYDEYGQAGSFGYQEGGQPDGRNAASGYSGNDWFGGQPDVSSGSGFVDTGTYSMNSRAIDEYGTGPWQAARGPVQGFPPAPSQPLALPSGFAGDGYDDYASDGQDGYGPGDYGQDGYGPAADYQDVRYGDSADTGVYPDAFDGMRPAGRGGRPGGRDGGSRSGGRRAMRVLLAALAVVVVGVAGTAAYKFWIAPRHATDTAAQQPLPTSGPSASTPACVKQFGTYCHIELRTDDPAPLAIAELYPPAFQNEQDHASFTLSATKLDKSCKSAVFGTGLQSALDAGHCTQVLRASYVSGDGKIMGTIGVVNLATTHEAHVAGKAVGKADFVAPLTASKGPASKMGKGTGMVESEFKGHYLILTWAEFVNGTKPSTTALQQQLQQWEADLVAGTANISLSQRMVDGAPPAPASPSGTASPSATASSSASAKASG